MKPYIQVFIFCLLAGPVFSQKKDAPTIQDIQRQMQEMQRQLFQQFDQMSPGHSFSMPEFKWDTTFSFNFDTTIIGGDGMGSRFFFAPFGQDTSAMRDFWGSDPFSREGNPFGGGFQWTFPPKMGVPENDENSAIDVPDDGLLPEERLRIQEEGKSKPSEKKNTPAPNNPKIKTIRIWLCYFAAALAMMCAI